MLSKLQQHRLEKLQDLCEEYGYFLERIDEKSVIFYNNTVERHFITALWRLDGSAKKFAGYLKTVERYIR